MVIKPALIDSFPYKSHFFATYVENGHLNGNAAKDPPDDHAPPSMEDSKRNAITVRLKMPEVER